MSKLNTVQNGKGSKKRPVKDIDQFNENWDLIFKKKKEEKPCKKEEKEDNK